jgi:LacI family transcriptional regulator
LNTLIDEIFVIIDLVTVGVLSYFNDIEIKIPEQVAVFGFSNWFMSQVLTPKLSTVDQPSHEMGVESFNLLLEEMIS